MKQEIGPRVFFGVLTVVLIVAVALAVWNWKRPSATALAQNEAETVAARNRAMAAPRGPNADQMKEIEDWKKANPNAPTRY